MPLDRTPLKDRARGRWKEVLPTFGVDSRWLDGKHHPCPICGGKDRWRFDDLKGEGTSICAQCGSRSGIQLVMDLKGLVYGEVAREIEKIIGTGPALLPAKPPSPDKTAAEKYDEAMAYWRSGKPVTEGDPVDLYLRHRIGKYNPTRAIRYIQATAFSGRTWPAMITAFVDVHSDLAGVQRTFLTADGRKAGLDPDRWNTGTLPEGGAIRLAAHDKLLGIAEGVETALSAALLYNMPVWAALNANRLEVWQPPEGVTEVVVFGDADENFVGQAAAYALAQRLGKEKTRTVQVIIPPDIGTDWNDVLQHQRTAA